MNFIVNLKTCGNKSFLKQATQQLKKVGDTVSYSVGKNKFSATIIAKELSLESKEPEKKTLGDE